MQRELLFGERHQRELLLGERHQRGTSVNVEQMNHLCFQDVAPPSVIIFRPHHYISMFRRFGDYEQYNRKIAMSLIRIACFVFTLQVFNLHTVYCFEVYLSNKNFRKQMCRVVPK